MTIIARRPFMPIINVSVTGKPDPDLSRRIANQAARLTKLHLKKDPAITAVAVHYVDPAHWFAGGTSLAEQNTNTFWLDIKVVDGANTKQEMASYLDAVFSSLSGLLGAAHNESYVLVHEVPAAAYGFGGKTQEFRFISSKLNPPDWVPSDTKKAPRGF
jgi:4-oxalocrotonate tautomerase